VAYKLVVWVFDEDMKIGCELHLIAEWATSKDIRISLVDSTAIGFWAEHLKYLRILFTYQAS